MEIMDLYLGILFDCILNRIFASIFIDKFEVFVFCVFFLTSQYSAWVMLDLQNKLVILPKTKC